MYQSGLDETLAQSDRRIDLASAVPSDAYLSSPAAGSIADLSAALAAEREAREKAEDQVCRLQQRLEQAEAAEQMLDALLEHVPAGIALAEAPDPAGQRTRRFGQLEERMQAMTQARCLVWFADIQDSGREDLQWAVQFASPAAARQFLQIECNPGESLVDAWRRSRGEQDLWESDTLGDKAVRAGSGYSQEYRWRTAHGAIRWLQEDVEVVEVEPHRQWRAVGVCMDITERKEAEDGLAWTLKAAGVGWLGESLVYDIATCSPEYADMLGIRPQDCTTAAALRSRVHPADLSRLDALRSQACAQGEQTINVPDIRVRHSDGSWRWHQMTYRLKYSPEGRPAWATGIAVDVTERRQVEEERERHLQEIGALNTRLLRSVTEAHHRVKNNLQTIAGLIEIHLGDRAVAVTSETLADLSRHIRGLAVIHDQLTIQARDGRGTEVISIREVLGKILPLMDAPLKGQRVQAEMADLWLSPRQSAAIALSINELVANSAKHAPGSQIRLTLSADEEMGRLVVEDNGPGFPPEFNPERSANTGLDLVLMLAQWDLGGEVHFANLPIGGAQVTISFPLVEPPQEG